MLLCVIQYNDGVRSVEVNIRNEIYVCKIFRMKTKVYASFIIH